MRIISHSSVKNLAYIPHNRIYKFKECGLFLDLV